MTADMLYELLLKYVTNIIVIFIMVIIINCCALMFGHPSCSTLNHYYRLPNKDLNMADISIYHLSLAINQKKSFETIINI